MRKILFILLIFNFKLSIFNSVRAQILFADYSDPDVCQGTDGDYWLTASSFQETPGLPILHSTDLVHWECVNFALHKLVPETFYNKVQHGRGVWAPSIRLHNGEYYIYWGDPDFGVFMVHTKDPRGKWSDPVWVINTSEGSADVNSKGIIDTTPLWDEDGRCYLVNGWAGSRAGFNSVITIRELSADGTKVIGEPRLVYDGLNDTFGKHGNQVNHTIEGPKLYKQDGYYYILAPAGGVEQGWEIALRSKNIYGPYESKIVFNKDGIHQGGWVGLSGSSGSKSSSGSNGSNGAFICFQDRGLYGRILHLLDVKMKDGWPMMSVNKNDKVCLPSAHEGYAWHSNYQDHYGFQAPGFTRIYGEYAPNDINFWNVDNLYLKKFEGESFKDTLRTVITAKGNGQQTGFIIMGRSYCRIAFEFQGAKGSSGSNGSSSSSDAKFIIKQIINNNADGLSVSAGSAAMNGKANDTEADADTQVIGEVKAQKKNAGANPVYQAQVSFIIDCKAPAANKKGQQAKGGLCTISYSTDGKKYTACPKTFQARQGKWIGAKYGVFAISPRGMERCWIDLMK